MELTLIPANQPRQTCPLHESDIGDSPGISLEMAVRSRIQVYYDVLYDLSVLWDGQVPDRVYVSINGEQKPGYFTNNGADRTDFHPGSQSSDYPLFIDCYGFVRIEFDCIYVSAAGTEHRIFYSDYLEVMIRPGPLSRALESMFAYIGKQHRRYLQTEAIRDRDTLDQMEKRDKTFERQIILYRQIQETFEYNLPFFKANPHQILESSYQVREFEKLQQIRPSTINYMIQHPDLLIPTDLPYGIPYQDQYYLPSQTLVLETFQSRDCYENAVVIGFFEMVIEGLAALLKKIDNYSLVVNRYSRAQGQYTSSVEVVMHLFRERLAEYRLTVDRMLGTMQSLYWTYKIFLPVDPLPLDSVPELTPVFLSVAPYRQVYEMIVQFFDFGSYNFRSEEFMLPFMVNSSVYEYYVLFKLAEALENENFAFQPAESQCFAYAIPDLRWKPLQHTNTFVFRDESGRTAVLYYQPAIFGNTYSESNNNGIHLRRATTHSLKDPDLFPGFSNGFYTPDYILKVRTGDSEKYLIADAKFRPFTGSILPDLVYKYAFSIQPTEPDSTVAGIAVLFGKEYRDRADLKDLLDIFSNERQPRFWFSSLTESEECTPESQSEMFRDLIGKLL